MPDKNAKPAIPTTIGPVDFFSSLPRGVGPKQDQYNDVLKNNCFEPYVLQPILLVENPQLFTKFLRQNLAFMWNSALWEKFNFRFTRDFY